MKVKKISPRIFLLGLFLCCSALLFAQNTEKSILAYQYLQSKKYEKAVSLYEELYKSEGTRVYYEYYLRCLVGIENYSEAEKLVKNELRKANKKADFYVDLGSIYRLQKEDKSAEKQFKQALNEDIENPIQAQRLANSLSKIGEKEIALNFLLDQRKAYRNPTLFSFEIADLYGALGNYEARVEELLSLLSYDPQSKVKVQDILQDEVQSSEEKEKILKQNLLSKIQGNADAVIYNEMLIWLQLQQGDFSGALLQAKALDKRFREDGTRIIQLADLFTNNNDLENALKAYEYVISKGSASLYYLQAHVKSLDIQYLMVQQSLASREAILQLEADYLTFLKEFGKNGNTAPIVKDLAHVQAFYLNKSSSAIELLKEVIAMNGVQMHVRATCKLELGDVYLLDNNIWEASLIYSQVESDFKDDELGREAKLRNAKLYYYAGDFDWAKAQLFVLRASTSQLIANDALDLGLLIADNTGLDSNEEALRMYSRAELHLFRNEFNQSLSILDSISEKYPKHFLEDEILYLKAKIFIKTNSIDSAIQLLNTIVQEHGEDILGDNALFMMAELYESRKNNLDKAQELYKQVLVDYPGSLLSEEARRRFRNLRGDGIVN